MGAGNWEEGEHHWAEEEGLDNAAVGALADTEMEKIGTVLGEGNEWGEDLVGETCTAEQRFLPCS